MAVNGLVEELRKVVGKANVLASPRWTSSSISTTHIWRSGAPMRSSS